MTENVACRTCGVPFAPRTSGGKPQIHCSAKCREKAADTASRRKGFEQRPTVCPECAGPIKQPQYGRPKRFCSEQCKKRVTNRAQNRQRLPAPRMPERQCTCGTTFTPKRRDQFLCGANCRAREYQRRKREGEGPRQGVDFVRQCVECGTDFVAKKANAKWCSPLCRIRTNGRDASRRRAVNPDDRLYVDREIFERDKWRCHLCGKPTRRDVDRRHPDGPTIDHIVPRVDGGADAPSNVATAHHRCNLLKGRRAMNEQLRLI